MPAGVTRRGSLDLASAATVTAGLAAVVFAVVRAPQAGWTSASTLVAGLGGLALLGLFVAMQARLREPLVRLGIFTAPNLAAANAAQFLLGAAWIPMFFFLNLYLQQVLGLGAFASGAALLPLTVTIMVGMVGVAPRLIARFGPKAMTVAGLATLAGGLVWLSFIRPDGSFTVDVLPASLVAAAGMAMAFIPSLGMALSSAAPGGGRPRRGHRQHQLPGRLRPRAGRDDRGRRRVRRRPGREPRRPSPTGSPRRCSGAAGDRRRRRRPRWLPGCGPQRAPVTPAEASQPDSAGRRGQSRRRSRRTSGPA